MKSRTFPPSSSSTMTAACVRRSRISSSQLASAPRLLQLARNFLAGNAQVTRVV